MKILIKLSVVFLSLFCLAMNESCAREGQLIFEELHNRDANYGDLKASVTMILKDKTGSPTIRQMEITNLEMINNEGTKTVVLFNSPLDVRETKVLTYSNAQKSDEQWIYLPAFKRVKQISDANKTSSFMGSEFTFEDINSITIQVPKFGYTYLKDETVAGAPCFVVERVPKYVNSGYKRQVVWIDSVRYVILKIEFYGQDNQLLKTLTINGYQQYLNKYWRAKEMIMVNNQNGKSTILNWEAYKFNNGLVDIDFDPSTLRR